MLGLPKAMEGRHQWRSRLGLGGFGFEWAKGHVVDWKDPLSIHESVFAVLFSTQITFLIRSQYFGI